MAEEKKPKAKVRYRTGYGYKRCGNCTMFRPPAACTAVAGVISAEGMCDLFDPKKKSEGK